MNQQSINDLQAEFGAIRQKLEYLEAKQENSKPAINSARRRGFSRGLAASLSPLVVLAVLFMSGLLYGDSPDALFIDENGNVGIGTNEPKAPLHVEGSAVINGDATIKGNALMSGDLTIMSTGTITIPAGTTAQRQTSPQNGALRYNTTAKMVEVFFEGMWFVIETTPYMGGNVKVFEYTGADQTFTVPEGVTKIFVKTWGAGGAGGTKGGWVYGSYGGGGGFSRGVLTTTSKEVLTIEVGRGGLVHQTDVGYGGGGAATINNHDNRYCGGGGGRSAVVGQGGVQLIVAGGGGGGGSTRSNLFWGKGNSGGAGGGFIGENGYSQYDEKHSFGGGGGGQDLAAKTR